MTLSMLNTIFLFHIKIQAIISSIPMYFTKCHNVSEFLLQKIAYVNE